MKCAMLVVSEVLTIILPSGLTPMPSGSTPTGISATHVLALDVDDGDQIVVLVGDVERLAVGREHEQLGVGAGGQRADDLVRRRVDHLDRVVVAGAEIEQLAVVRDGDAARPLADLDRS